MPNLSTIRHLAAQLSAAEQNYRALGMRNTALDFVSQIEQSAEYAVARAEVLKLRIALEAATAKYAGYIP